ncbi:MULTISPECIES: DUF4232 domain-containing protein [unclassified Streptomyces]|uniref:DUF4232 domain-containing protein n=1 Tax=unclassified Streptomyces TaxID=2593676 RepID=UPI00342213E8
MSNLRNRRKNVRKAAAALTGAAALMALLTACNGTATGSVKTDNGAAAPAAGSATGSTGGSDATPNGGSGSGSGGGSGSGNSGTSGSAGSGGSTSGGSSSGGSAAGTSVPSCQASQLGYSWADPGSGTGQQKHAVVAFTNKSGHSCTMYGFPGVDLVNSGQKWSLQRTNATPKRVTLANGASTNFAITFLVPAQGDSTTFTPTTVVVTAPNQRTSFDLSWHGGAVLLQDGATHPGTFIGPVGE